MRMSCIMILALVAASCLAAGCSSGTAPHAPETMPVTSPQVPATAAGTPAALHPGPTQTLPPEYYVTFDVQKQEQAGIPTITAIFRGGTGMAFTSKVTVTVTRSDGKVITETMDHPAVGDEVDIEGTRYDDRTEITVLVSTGNSYTVYDQLLPYQSVN